MKKQSGIIILIKYQNKIPLTPTINRGWFFFLALSGVITLDYPIPHTNLIKLNSQREDKDDNAFGDVYKNTIYFLRRETPPS